MNRTAKALLIAALVAVVGMAFRVSWNALRDVASTVGADATAALLYPFVVDGLMALALVATLALTGRDRTFALRVLAGYALASLILNYVHGLMPEPHGAALRMRLADWAPANWALVLLATSLPVGSIFFGSDLVAKVLHHVPTHGDASSVLDVRDETAEHPGPASVLDRTGDEQPSLEPARDTARRTPDTPPPPRTPASKPARTATAQPSGHRTQFQEAETERKRQEARRTYAESLDAGHPLGPKALGEAYGFSEGWGRKQIKAVHGDGIRRPLVAVGAGDDT